MSELSNSDRAARGQYALTVYGLHVAPHGEDEDTLAGDLVADLMHALERLGFNPVMAVEMGMEHYYAECAELVGTTSTRLPDPPEMIVVGTTSTSTGK